MNYNKMKKDDLIEHIKFLKQDFEQMNIAHLAKFQSIKNSNKELLEANENLRIENASLIDCHNVATKEIESLNNRLKKHRRSTKRRLTRLKNYHESKQSAVDSLFELYSSILLEDNWEERIEWKNDLLSSVQNLIQDLS